jgi:hypothetical protein
MKFDLTDFDNRLMDGFNFCKKVYTVFEHIRKSPNGTKRLRLRKKDKMVKKLIEELIPIAQYVQERYNHGNQIKVRWIDGGQQYDARLLVSGVLVDRGLVPKRQYVEATMAVHEKEHILRRILDEEGHAFSVKGIYLDKHTKKPVSQPYVYTKPEAENDLASKILERIVAKSRIRYPRETVLLIQCVTDTLFHQDNWEYMIEQVKKAPIDHRFREILISDSNCRYSATIYPKAQIINENEASRTIRRSRQPKARG